MSGMNWEKAKLDGKRAKAYSLKAHRSGSVRPATKKQLDFLVKLGDEGSPPATKSQAQSRIDLALNERRRITDAKMASEPPTKKQLKALKKFGVKEVPVSKLRAKDLIASQYAQAKKANRTKRWQQQQVDKCEVTFVDPATLRSN